MKPLHGTYIALLGLALLGCSFALDMDSLQEGTKDTGNNTISCTDDSDCGDGIDCTDDVCSSDNTCANLPVNSECDYLEICDPDLGCIPSGFDCLENEDCDDEVDCTVDICALGECSNTPDHEYCASDNPCIVDEACDPINGCLPGAEMDCGLSEEICSYLECNPASGECEDYPMDTADNDNDSYLDWTCGGDDCDDEDENIHPEAVDLCDGIDNNCDGATDLSIMVDRTVITTEASISSPSVAAGSGNYVVTWQLNGTSATEVYARFLEPDGTMASDGYNFTSLGGSGSSGYAPSIVAGADSFYVAWAAETSSSEKSALMVPLTLNETSSLVESGTLVTLSTGDVATFTPIQIAWDDSVSGGAWIAAWSAEQSEGTFSVRVQTPDMGDASFTVVSDTVAMGEVSLAAIDEHDYVIAYSALDDVVSNDMEVFESRVQLSGSLVWENASGYPAMISTPNSAEVDPSTNPKVAIDGAGGWVIVYNDALDDASALDDDLMAWNGTTNSTLIDGVGGTLEEIAWAWSGTDYGLLYVTHAQSGTGPYVEMLDFMTYDSTLVPPPVPYAGTMLLDSPVTLPEQDVKGTAIVGDGSGGFAAVWIETAESEDSLTFAAFGTCQSE